MLNKHTTVIWPSISLASWPIRFFQHLMNSLLTSHKSPGESSRCGARVFVVDFNKIHRIQKQGIEKNRKKKEKKTKTRLISCHQNDTMTSVSKQNATTILHATKISFESE